MTASPPTTPPTMGPTGVEDLLFPPPPPPPPPPPEVEVEVGALLVESDGEELGALELWVG